MLKLHRKLYLVSFLLFSFFCTASPVSPDSFSKLHQRILTFLNQQRAGHDIMRKVEILSTPEQLKNLCDNAKISQAGGGKFTGAQSLLLQCGNKRTFVRIRVEAEGTYWVANRVIKPRQTIREKDLYQQHGSLAQVPADVLFASEGVSDRVATRMIAINQPLARHQLRNAWKIVNGSLVSVVTPGNGFLIKAKGKAMNNAAAGQTLRVRMKSGKIVSGTVMANGEVVINPV